MLGGSCIKEFMFFIVDFDIGDCSRLMNEGIKF